MPKLVWKSANPWPWLLAPDHLSFQPWLFHGPCQVYRVHPLHLRMNPQVLWSSIPQSGNWIRFSWGWRSWTRSMDMSTSPLRLWASRWITWPAMWAMRQKTRRDLTLTWRSLKSETPGNPCHRHQWRECEIANLAQFRAWCRCSQTFFRRLWWPVISLTGEVTTMKVAPSFLFIKFFHVFPSCSVKLDYWNIMGISDIGCVPGEDEIIRNWAKTWETNRMSETAPVCSLNVGCVGPVSPLKKRPPKDPYEFLMHPERLHSHILISCLLELYELSGLGPACDTSRSPRSVRSVRSVVSVVPPDVPAEKMIEVDVPGLLQCRPENEALSAEQVKPQRRPGVRCTSW